MTDDSDTMPGASPRNGPNATGIWVAPTPEISTRNWAAAGSTRLAPRAAIKRRLDHMRGILGGAPR